MSDALTSEGAFPHAVSRLAALRRVSGAEVVDEGIQLARQNYAVLVMAGLLPLLPSVAVRVWHSSHEQQAGLWSNLLVILSNTVWGSLAGAAAARVAMD